MDILTQDEHGHIHAQCASEQIEVLRAKRARVNTHILDFEAKRTWPDIKGESTIITSSCSSADKTLLQDVDGARTLEMLLTICKEYDLEEKSSRAFCNKIRNLSKIDDLGKIRNFDKEVPVYTYREQADELCVDLRNAQYVAKSFERLLERCKKQHFMAEALRLLFGSSLVAHHRAGLDLRVSKMPLLCVAALYFDDLYCNNHGLVHDSNDDWLLVDQVSTVSLSSKGGKHGKHRADVESTAGGIDAQLRYPHGSHFAAGSIRHDLLRD